MLDLVQEEQLVAELTKMDFDSLLEALDAFDPGALQDRYAEVCDGYMVLSLNGHRTHEQDMMLDRLDSSLRMLLKDRGLLVQAGKMLAIGRTASACEHVFRNDSASLADIFSVHEGMTRCQVLASKGLAGPLPMDGSMIAFYCDRVRVAADSLAWIRDKCSGISGLVMKRQVARDGVFRLTKQLHENSAGIYAIDVVASLVSEQYSARDRIKFLDQCYRLAGWSSCGAIVTLVKESLGDLAGLIREGLGA